jgi:hypothetical protein
MTADYKNTVFLPSTDFPMKAGLPDLEPKLLARWEQTVRPMPTAICISVMPSIRFSRMW